MIRPEQEPNETFAMVRKLRKGTLCAAAFRYRKSPYASDLSKVRR